MKKSVFMTQTAEELATSLIGDLGHGPATEHGDRTSGYFVLLQAVDNEDEQVTVAITEVKNDIEGNPYYCIHCVDDVTPADCDLFYSRDLTAEALAATLKVIAGEFHLVNRPGKRRSQRATRTRSNSSPWRWTSPRGTRASSMAPTSSSRARAARR